MLRPSKTAGVALISLKNMKPANVKTTSFMHPDIFVANGPHIVAARADENSIKTPNKPETTTQTAKSRLKVLGLKNTS